MTEREWLTCSDLYRMIGFRYVQPGIGQNLDEEKRLVFTSLGANGLGPQSAFPHDLPNQQKACEIIREVIGNPFRPVSLCGVTEGIEKIEYTPDCDNCRPILQWNNGTIPAMVQAIKSDADRLCLLCRGKGKAYFMEPAKTRYLWTTDPPKIEDMPKAIYGDCQECKGEGRIRRDIDATAMAILADACEEAGCTDEAILQHLRGTEQCPHCDGEGKDVRDNNGNVWVSNCSYCGGTNFSSGTGFRPIKHLAECWVLRLLLP